MLMKLCSIPLLLLACSLMACDRNNESTEEEPAAVMRLPIILKEGYGPFHPNFGILTAERSGDPFLGKLYLPITGVPKRWSNVTRTMVWLDSRQLIYQNFKQGNFTFDQFQSIQKQSNWTLDTTKLSAKSIKCYVYVIKGFDESQNRWAVMVDANNNLNFADEVAVYPAVSKPGLIPDQIDNVTKVQ